MFIVSPRLRIRFRAPFLPELRIRGTNRVRRLPRARLARGTRPSESSTWGLYVTGGSGVPFPRLWRAVRRRHDLRSMNFAAIRAWTPGVEQVLHEVARVARIRRSGDASSSAL